MTEAIDYRDTVFLPKTDFPMKAGLPQKEPVILARWQEQRLYEELRNRRAGAKSSSCMMARLMRMAICISAMR
jgi:isoleucyl-tRNA synthetase